MFKRLVENVSLENCSVTVIWSNAERPAIIMSLHNIEDVAQVMFEQDFDTWIVCEKHKWCIECHHDGSIGIVLS